MVIAWAQFPEYYEFKADIPGQSKDKISVTIDGHRLHIAVVSTRMHALLIGGH